MKHLRIHDIIGPIMVGPSSSHTAGALRIASMALKLCQCRPAKVEFLLYGSFAHTFRGHGTDRALCAGILGLEAGDLRIRDSLGLAREAGIEVVFTPLPDAEYSHPNTVDIILTDEQGDSMVVRGESIGGGNAVLRRINGVDLYITGEKTSIVVSQLDEPGILAHIATCLSAFGINIATTRMYREHKGSQAYTIMETDAAIPGELKTAIANHPSIQDVRVIPADTAEEAPVEEGAAGKRQGELATGSAGAEKDGHSQSQVAAVDGAGSFGEEDFALLDFASGAEMLRYCEAETIAISEAFLRREQALCAYLGISCEAGGYLHEVLEVMRESAVNPIAEKPRSMGGLIGGEANKLDTYRHASNGVCDPMLAQAATYALAVLETNASMGRIVAAPTAGSSGVLPALLLALGEYRGFSDDRLESALATAAAIGYLITRNATVSGAEGGCQAEIGSAAAMAAAAATELAGGSPRACFEAASNALTNMMGLVCDPIGGLVEVPCQKRNASGAATALVSAEIALAGIQNLVDFDQTVEALYKVGRSLPFELRESGLGGIAATPSACAFCAGC